MTTGKRSLEKLIDELAKQCANAALKLDKDEKLADKVDVLKALTALQSVKNRAQPEEPEGKGFNGLASLLSTGAAPAGDTGDDDDGWGDDDPDAEPNTSSDDVEPPDGGSVPGHRNGAGD